MTTLSFSIIAGAILGICTAKAEMPNIILIYADDLGYGDVGCYGAKAVLTPNIDRLAEQGLRFTSGYATSATCTPSRYGLMTGEYPWRKKGTNILPGDAALIIPVGSVTLPSILQGAGYTTGVVGKWHLGLGGQGNPLDWNGGIKPGPREVGFNYNFIMAATGDRVPSVFVEGDRVVNLDPQDPIAVSYDRKIGSEPTGRENPGLLKMKADDQHSDTITNGISRIGFMSGGKAACWKDEELGDQFTAKALEFIERQQKGPFFLYFALHEPHVPRIPAPRFVGQSELGPRGDAIAQADDHVGKVMQALERLNLTRNTLVIVTSDNGPVLNDGYQDQSISRNGNHTPAGPFSGGKYSNLEGGTRVPLIVSWPGHISAGISDAMVSQIDFLASFAALAGQKVPEGSAPDSGNALEVLLGGSRIGRSVVVEQGQTGLALRQGGWKIIPNKKGDGGKFRLYHLDEDVAEKKDVSEEHPEKISELSAALDRIVALRR